MDSFQGFAIEYLINSSLGEKISHAFDVIANVQRSLLALAEGADNKQLNLLKIGTVFQLFLIDTLATGKKLSEFSEADWKNIANKVAKYAILEDGQLYSEFVFTMYADYVDLSVKSLRSGIEFLQKSELEDRLNIISNLSTTIRENTNSLHAKAINETSYIENNLWLSLEAMMKIFSCFLSVKFCAVAGADRARLVNAISDLAFEYGRFVMYAKEQAILEEYIQSEYELDNLLQNQYDAYLAELYENAARFQKLIENAFSPGIKKSLIHSAELARAYGVKEEELLAKIEDVDNFFLS